MELEHVFDESFRAVGHRRYPHRDDAWKAARWLSKWATVAIVDRSCVLFPDVMGYIIHSLQVTIKTNLTSTTCDAAGENLPF